MDTSESDVIDVAPEVPRIAFRERLRLKARHVRTVARKAWNATDITDRVFFPGIALIGIGMAYQFRPATAAIVVGTLMILAVRPLRRWL